MVALTMLTLPAARAATSDSAPLPWRTPPVTISVPSPPPGLGAFGTDVINLDYGGDGAGREGRLPATSFGLVRIWDDEATWADVEPGPGQWHLQLLDRQVSDIRRSGADPLYVLGQTPSWAAGRPRHGNAYGPAAGTPPASLTTWQNYVSTIVHRYKGRIGAYELWDEADATFKGTPEQMVQLALVAYRTIKQVDPTAVVLTPSVSQNALASGWLTRYLDAGGALFADAFAAHIYAPSPEAGGAVLMRYRSALRAAHAKLPIWVTEVGYRGYSPTGRPLYGDQAAQALVARTLMDQIEGGATRLVWYGEYSEGAWLSLGDQVYSGDRQAYTTMRSWLSGATPEGCGGFASGAYAGLAGCYLQVPAGPREVMLYDPGGTLAMSTPADRSVEVSMLSGATETLAPGSVVTLGPVPILVSSS